MDRLVFILSTGRTGTQFFEDYINGTTDRALCRHEPHPSRRFKFLSNMYLTGRVSGERIARIYGRSRNKLLRKAGDRIYIESSNFMFGCIPALNRVYPDIRVIHIVRHPVTYVVSHLNKGFWRGHKRFFARHVPYWLETLELKDPRNPVEVLSGRYNLVNRQIASYAGTNPYLRLTFEELFAGRNGTGPGALNRVREFCGIDPLTEEENRRWLERPKNRSPRSHRLSGEEVAWIEQNNADLMKEYGYGGTPG